MDESNLKELYEAISKRMSVREYGEEIVKPELCDKIDEFIEKINKEEDIFQSKTRFLLMREKILADFGLLDSLVDANIGFVVALIKTRNFQMLLSA